MSSTSVSNKAAPAPLGIPQAPFAENAEDLLIAGETAQGTFMKFDELLNKYRMMEFSLNAKRQRLNAKVDDLQKSLAAIKGLQQHPDCTFRYEINDTLYARAKLAEPAALKTVHLWLGANVMLSYPVEEALPFLADKLRDAQGMVAQCESDLLYLRDQITTMEVSIARIYNLVLSASKQKRPE